MNYLWLIFGFLLVLFVFFVVIFGKIGLKGIDINVVIVIRVVIMVIFLIIVVVFQGRLSKVLDVLVDKKVILFIVLSGVVGVLLWFFYFLVFKNGKVQQVVLIDRFLVVFVIVFVVIFFGEKVLFYIVIGVLLIVVGFIFVVLG